MSSSSICTEHLLVHVLVQRGHTCCASLAVRYLIDMVQGTTLLYDLILMMLLCHSPVIVETLSVCIRRAPTHLQFYCIILL